eukprot:TRINITY_DN8175_c0_g1_i1.p1 TRINITY_DN8175_c0_g1~~TRINITY_DN8175_c0_g1_i1.p1  ORF type:complete len:625 (+),score=119.78 TRINITY_DN8175_c0_g1_i1:205-1875(+)
MPPIELKEYTVNDHRSRTIPMNSPRLLTMKPLNKRKRAMIQPLNFESIRDVADDRSKTVRVGKRPLKLSYSPKKKLHNSKKNRRIKSPRSCGQERPTVNSCGFGGLGDSEQIHSPHQNVVQNISDLRTSANIHVSKKGSESSSSEEMVEELVIDDHINSNKYVLEDGQLKMANYKELIYIWIQNNCMEKLTLFIIVHEKYVATLKVLEELFKIYRNEELNTFGTVIKFRVIRTIQSWVRYKYYNCKDKKSLRRLKKFLRKRGDGNKVEKGWQQLLQQEIDNVNKIYQNSSITNIPEVCPGAPKIILSKKLRRTLEASNATFEIRWNKIKFTDIDVREMARQISLKVQLLYKKIRVEDLLKNYDESELTQDFNECSLWVATAIVTEENLKTRTKLLSYFISLSNQFMQLKNFHSAFSVYSGLTIYCVMRLKDTWKGLSDSALTKWQNLENMFDPCNNFARFKRTIEEADTPKTSCLMIVIKDLIYVNETMQDFDEGTRMINIAKVERIGCILKDVIDAQKIQYQNSFVNIIHMFLDNISITKEEELDQLSFVIEPQL